MATCREPWSELLTGNRVSAGGSPPVRLPGWPWGSGRPEMP